jgi:galactokinase
MTPRELRDAFDATAPSTKHGWAAYAHGVAWALAEAGHALRGFDAVFTGDVPRGAGLSSSAALELALARAFAEASDLPWDPAAMAVACRRAENAWVGVASGIMDQLISACGEAGSALLIDCRDLSTQAVPIPAGTRVVILDTGTRRGLVGSAYNERRAQVDAAAEGLGVPVLRDATTELLNRRGDALDPVVLRRARHVIGENARVLEAADAMRRGDAATLGRLMDASHASLRDDFEVSGPALDAMVEVARAHDGCLGARMTGAGFAGCCVALVDEARLDDFVAEVGATYQARTGNEPALYPVRASAGAGPLEG